jgi:hypothetical protein
MKQLMAQLSLQAPPFSKGTKSPTQLRQQTAYVMTVEEGM